MSDHSLESAVMQALADNPLVHADEIAVDNDVTLAGTVASRGHREAVIAAAAATPGVVQVHDALVMRPDPS